MEKLTATQIIQKIADSGISVRQFGYFDFNSDELGLGEITEVSRQGGEGKGEDWHSVKYFVDHDVYIKTEAFYSSYHGCDFEYGYGEEVRLREKTITVYE
jgi:hypothetical protein